jgi:hypothetical protein
MTADSTRPPSTPLLERSDVAIMLVLMAVGLALRLAYFSGYGLGDDRIYRYDIVSVLEGRLPISPQNSYRFSWWLPTAVSSRFFGLTEAGLIAPITAFSVLGIGVVYVLGKLLWGRPGGWIAAALLIVHPLDFAWATMLAPDVILSVFSALCLLFVLRALAREDDLWKRRSWTLAAIALWLAYHSKLSAVLLIPAIVLIVALQYRRLDRNALAFAGTAALLFSGSTLVSWALTGDPVAPYHGELVAQGLSGPVALGSPRVTREVFLIYPRLMFLRDNTGDLLYSVYPHALVLLAAASPWLGIRTSLPVLVWFAAVFFGLELNVQRVADGWIAGFRNIRHTHVFIYPLILLLTGYLVTLRARYPRSGTVALALLLAFSTWESTATASRTVTAFGDIRRAAHFLANLPRKPIHSDFQLVNWLPILHVAPPLMGQELVRDTSEQSRTQLANIHSGYLVTGGGREPYYGCVECIPRADDLLPARWRLLMEFQGPPATWWRPEALRVWEAIDGELPPAFGSRAATE